jgi:hypothetical protein
MDSDHTQAAGTPAEEEQPPTVLADPAAEGETQSINAWSLAEDDESTEVTPYQQHSWRRSIALAAAGLVALVGVGLVVYKVNDAMDHSGEQRHLDDVTSSPTVPPAAAPSAVVPPPQSGAAPTARPSEPVLPSFKADPAVDAAQKQDAYFLDLLGKRGWPLTGPTEPLRWEGRNVCAEMQGPQHLSYLQVTKKLAAEHSTNDTTADMFVNAAVTSYCPHELGY